MTAAPLRVAVLGAGTVGREVVRGLLAPSARMATARSRLELAGVAVRDIARATDAGLPADLLTDAPAHLVASPDTDVVVELLGGDEPAHTLIAAALSAGKPVVSANKHVIAHHGAELEAIARRTNAAFRFEAAVGGGIPILGPLAVDLAANDVTRVRGIVNGTTNLILSRMAEEGAAYEDVLADAQAAGFAEADPSGDVEGDDAANKLAILARLAFGGWPDPAAIRRTAPAAKGWASPGITAVTSRSVAGAHALGLMIRLLAVAERRDGDPSIRLSVMPTALDASSALGRTGGVRNRVEVDASPVGTVGFDGPGAGGPATSSAVLADLLAIDSGAGSTWAGLAPAEALGPSRVTDGLDGDQAWFVSVDRTARSALADIVDIAVDCGDEVAVRTVSTGLDELRARLASVPAAVIHPIDD